MMRRGLLYTLIILIPLFLINCRSRDNSGTGQMNEKSYKRASSSGDEATENLNPPEAGGVWIKHFAFAQDSLKPGATLKLDTETNIPEEREHTIVYSFFKNGRKLLEQTEQTLDRSLYKRGDFINAIAHLYMNGQLAEEKNTDAVIIANSPPVLQDISVPNINGPGTYQIPVKAEDSDGDTLTYELLPAGEDIPIPNEVEIDKDTGIITCTLGNKPPSKEWKFVVDVNDGNGANSKKMVTINFEVTRKVEPPSGEKK